MAPADSIKHAVKSEPIFILACGWRSGSTLLQRLLCSHPDIHIWGENRGICSALDRAASTVAGFEGLSRHGAVEFTKAGTNGWIAMLNPPHAWFMSSMAVMLDLYFGEPVRRGGKRRWGFKEVRHGAETADFLASLFPKAKFLFLVRDPTACLASARATASPSGGGGLLAEVGGPDTFLAYWTRIACSFYERPCQDARLVVRYEQLVGQPEPTIGSIAEFLGLAPEGFAREVLAVRRRGWREAEPRLTDQDRQALDDVDVRRVAGLFGYSLNRQPAES